MNTQMVNVNSWDEETGLFACPVYFWNALQLGTGVFDRHLPSVFQSATNITL